MRRLAYQARTQVRPLEDAMTATNEQIDKARLVASTDPEVIASVRRNQLNDVIGTVYGNTAYVYKWSLERWLSARATSSSSGAP